MITIDIDDRGLCAAVQRLRLRLDDLRPVMHDIGEHLAETARQRFARQRAPIAAPSRSGSAFSFQSTRAP